MELYTEHTMHLSWTSLKSLFVKQIDKSARSSTASDHDSRVVVELAIRKLPLPRTLSSLPRASMTTPLPLPACDPPITYLPLSPTRALPPLHSSSRYM